jgi:hypothetical protein
LFDVATKGPFYSLTRNAAGRISLRDKWTTGESASEVAFWAQAANLAQEEKVREREIMITRSTNSDSETLFHIQWLVRVNIGIVSKRSASLLQVCSADQHFS